MLRCAEDYLKSWIDHYPNVIALGSKKRLEMNESELKTVLTSDQLRLRYLKRKRTEVDVEIGFVEECIVEAQAMLNGGKK